MKTKTYTEKELNGFKGFVLIGVALAFIVDVFVMASLAVSGFGYAYYIIPAIMLLLDVGFFVIATVSNFRFGYSLFYTLSYAFGVTVLWFAYLLQTTLLSSVAFITIMAMALFIAVHVVSAVAIVLSAVSSAKFGRGVKILAVIVLTIFTAFAVFYSYFMFKDGFTGQGFNARVVSYEYDKDTDTYTAVGIEGKGGNVATIGETFNGKKVSKIDCAIFTGTVDSVTIKASDYEFVNYSALSDMNKNIKISVSEDSINRIKSEIYEIAVENEYDNSIISFANAFEPTSEKASISFVYTADSLKAIKAAGEEVLGVWYGDKGTVFSLNEYSNGYITHSNAESEADLYWCYTFFNKKVLKPISLDGQKITKNEKVKIEFENVYKISLTNGNDNLYRLPTSVSSVQVGAEFKGGRYVTLSTADKFLSSLPSRNGFSVVYTTDDKVINSLSETLKSKDSDLIISPEWSLNAPTIKGIKTDASSYVYGDNVIFSGEATAPIDGMSLKYNWKKGDALLNEANSFTKTNVKPTESGSYTLTVTAYGTNTSLTSVASKTINVAIGKKKLDFNWTLPANMSYSGTNKSVYCTYDSTQVINGDGIQFDCSLTTVKDAGNYVSKVTLKGDCADLYVLTNTATKSFTINPYTATLNWSTSSFVYNGAIQVPTAKFYGVGGDGELVANVLGATSKNVGGYSAIATTDNLNYKFSNANYDYAIVPKELNYTWGATSFVFNGKPQAPAVTLSGLVSGDSAVAKVGGAETNAKNGYTATIIGVDNSNYTISGQPNVSFDIAPLEKSVVWENLSFVYDKTAKLPKAYYENVFGAKITLKVEASGDNVNAGSFSATASEITTDENYTLTNLLQDAIEIAKKSLTLSWSNVSLTFNGEEQKPTATLNGVISGDVVSVTLTINEGKSVNAGNYTAVASITSDNYSLVAASKEYVISKKNVTAVWENLAVEYNGAEQKPTAHYIDVNGDNIELAVTASGDCINVGEYSVEAALADTNYELSGGNNTLTISPAVIAISWTGGGETHSFEFSGAVPSIVSEGLSATISSGVIGSDVVDVIVSMSDNYNVGSYIASANIKGEQPNYVISSDCKTCNYTITPVIVDIIWGNTSFVYDGLNHRPEKPHYNDIGGNAVELNVIGDLAQNVGEYEVTAGDITNENYVANEATKKCSFSIVPASGTVSWTIAKTYYYDYGNEIDVVLSATFECITTKPYATTLSSSNPSDGLTIEILGGAVVNAGSYTAKVTLSNGNFKISSNETFTFEVKALPVALGFTVGDVSKTVDEIKSDGLTKAEASELMASYVYGDDVNLSATVKFMDADGTEVAASDLQVGNTYKIVIASLSDDNYTANAASTNIEFTVKE